MNSAIVSLLYMASAVLFIRGIKLMGKAESARRGNRISSLGMLTAVVTVLSEKEVLGSWSSDLLHNGYLYIALAVLMGSVIGIVMARSVKMTGIPELVALFNGFGGLSSLLVALSQHITKPKGGFFTSLSLALTVAIGAVAFTGSAIAWGKLSGKAFKKSLQIPGRNIVNAVIAALGLGGTALYVLGFSTLGLFMTALLFLILGITLVAPIGGGDMPVVISFLNALSGLAAAAAGFAISNAALVVSGCLVGASGLILTKIMCKAMNRTFSSLLFKSFGKSSRKASGEAREPRPISVEDAYLILEAARNVVIVPGYGMAVAQAQHAVKELSDKLEANGAEVSFSIHPVAGRMPGHMNVLLAEANIPYKQLKPSEELNPRMSQADVAIVIGANDVVNPDALNDESSPLYGMPIVNAFEAKTVFVLKRGKGTGFSGVENPLFTNDNTVMLYGDAKETVSALSREFGAAS